MIKFVHKKTGEVKEAYSIKKIDGDYIIKFTADGKKYTYKEQNIEILSDVKNGTPQNKKDPIIYCYDKECYNCHKTTKIITYIVFNDGSNEDAVYPWDKRKALKGQDLILHMKDPSIEYYGIYVIGDIPEFDEMLMEKYPGKIDVKYSNVVHRSYPMNLCDCCKKPQGKYHVYRDINQIIAQMKPIDILK